MDIKSFIDLFGILTEKLYIYFNAPKVGVNHKNSHIRKDTGKPKIRLTKENANKEAIRMQKKGEKVKAYVCPVCDNYHVGHYPDSQSKMKIFQDFMFLLSSIISLYNLYKVLIRRKRRRNKN